ncbi:hypothetical protein [Geosporobacter ferrireducens]|uniref:Zinc-ribbon domain-containing protein n=2 Tax=Geosporobacter ferrireducens TaxID=1424294 RepID=A0A1D8GE29_9FIRM|nr:hypothetical protein [Geosporobacter ferrireducens]AOT69148.1 hypothetical protein Gferi_05980 [Geosporobacter ferrireducens]MTI56826.1 hypothetical protein [Geosporobacter ferrireducens]
MSVQNKVDNSNVQCLNCGQLLEHNHKFCPICGQGVKILVTDKDSFIHLSDRKVNIISKKSENKEELKKAEISESTDDFSEQDQGALYEAPSDIQENNEMNDLKDTDLKQSGDGIARETYDNIFNICSSEDIDENQEIVRENTILKAEELQKSYRGKTSNKKNRRKEPLK